MTPLELQRALAATPYRSAQVLSHRLLDGRTREECASLYGLPLPAWDVLFLRSARDFEHAGLGRSPPRATFEQEQREAVQLADSLTPELRELEAQRDEVRRLINEAEAAAEQSPARARETWLRRIAIVAIIALTAYFWWRQQQKEKPIPYVPYLTQPKQEPRPPP